MKPKATSKKLDEFAVVMGFKNGYRNREDKTILPPGTLIEGSQNVLTNTAGRVGTRKGYTLDGAASTTLAPILSSFDWETHVGTVQHLRAGFLTTAANDGKLQFRYDSGTTITWYDLLTSLTSTSFNFADYWDSTLSQSKLLMVNGSAVGQNGKIYKWSGGVTTASSSTNDGVMSLYNGTLTSLTASTTATGATAYAVDYTTDTFATYQAASFLQLPTNPTAAQNYTMTVNGTIISFAFVGALVNPGDVIIGATASDTRTNLLGMLQSPNTTTATHQALTNATKITYIQGFTSSLGGTITKSGTTTWAQAGFDSYGIHTITVNGTNYTAIGDWATTTLYVTGQPSGISSGDVIYEAVETINNSTVTGLPTVFSNDLIAVLKNQVYIGSLKNNQVYVSKINGLDISQRSFGYSPTRVVGEGAIFTLDAPPRAFVPQDNEIYISAGLSQWYLTQFTQSANLVYETLEVTRLKTTSQQGTQSQALTTKIRNNIAFLSNEPVMTSLGPVQNVLNVPQTSDLSSPIVDDINDLDFTNGTVCYWKNYLLLSAPVENRVLIYNMTDPNNRYWEAPQILPISCFSIIDGELYGHGYLTSESYKLFDGYNDNNNFIESKAVLSYNNYGSRFATKQFAEYYIEGYIAGNTTLTRTTTFDIDGCATTQAVELEGTADQVCISTGDNSLGKYPLGNQPLGSNLLTTDPNALPPKFRIIQTATKVPFYEESTTFSSNGLDQQWELICAGPAIQPTTEGNNAITV